MKNTPFFLCFAFVVLSGAVQAQKFKIYRAKVVHFDYSATKGIVYDVSPQGIVLLDSKVVSAMSTKEIQSAVLNDQLPQFTVPFREIQAVKIKRRGAAGKGFGLGYLASFVTLETIMAASVLSSGDKMGCDGSPRKATLSDALIGASCAAPPGILVFGIVSFVGGGIGSLIGSIPVREFNLDPHNPETDAREKLQKYALLMHTNRPAQIR
jgi:hypothetical protein